MAPFTFFLDISLGKLRSSFSVSWGCQTIVLVIAVPVYAAVWLLFLWSSAWDKLTNRWMTSLALGFREDSLWSPDFMPLAARACGRGDSSLHMGRKQKVWQKTRVIMRRGPCEQHPPSYVLMGTLAQHELLSGPQIRHKAHSNIYFHREILY